MDFFLGGMTYLGTAWLKTVRIMTEILMHLGLRARTDSDTRCISVSADQVYNWVRQASLRTSYLSVAILHTNDTRGAAAAVAAAAAAAAADSLAAAGHSEPTQVHPFCIGKNSAVWLGNISETVPKLSRRLADPTSSKSPILKSWGVISYGLIWLGFDWS